MLIYKILRPSEWAEFEASGIFDGSADDRRDGFIHCSSRDQVAATAVRIFGDETKLVVVTLSADLLGATVRWEPSSAGELFPHVYASLPSAAVVAVHHVAGSAGIEQAIS